MPKQEFDFLDMMAPLVVALIFAFIVFVSSPTSHLNNKHSFLTADFFHDH